MNLTIDFRTLGALGRYQVEQTMHELDLRDYGIHRLHFVREGETRLRFHRALQLDDGRTYALFDLRLIAKTLGAEIPGYLDRDVPGLIKYTLRALYPTGLALRRAIAAVALHIGVPEGATE